MRNVYRVTVAVQGGSAPQEQYIVAQTAAEALGAAGAGVLTLALVGPAVIVKKDE